MDDNRFFINESINDKGIFKAVYMAGHSGAGKSYVLSHVKSGSIDPRLINVDKFSEFFAKNLSFLGKIDAYDGYYWSKARMLTTHQIANYIDGVLPLAIDVTAASPNAVVRRYGILEFFGYDQAMVFVNCSLETALERAEKRERRVRPEVVIAYYEEVKKLKGYLKQKFSPFIEVNNDIGELTDEVVINAFNKMESFYNSPVRNRLGLESITVMRENKWKYLSDGVHNRKEIEKMASMWYY